MKEVKRIQILDGSNFLLPSNELEDVKVEVNKLFEEDKIAYLLLTNNEDFIGGISHIGIEENILLL